MTSKPLQREIYKEPTQTSKTQTQTPEQKSFSLRSKRFRASSSVKLRREQKKGMTGERERKERNACPQTAHDFEKLRSPTNAVSDWCGAGSVNYLALETSIKPGILCLRASQIWSHLICGRRLQMPWTDIYLSRVCAKVYEIRVL